MPLNVDLFDRLFLLILSNLLPLVPVRLLFLGGGARRTRGGNRGGTRPWGRQHGRAEAHVGGLSLPWQRHRKVAGSSRSGVCRAQQLRRHRPWHDGRQVGSPQAVRVAGLPPNKPERGLQAPRDEPLAAGEALLPDPLHPLPPAAPWGVRDDREREREMERGDGEREGQREREREQQPSFTWEPRPHPLLWQLLFILCH